MRQGDAEMDEGEEDEADDLEVGSQEDSSVGDDCMVVEAMRHPHQRNPSHQQSRDGARPDAHD